jgi:hypothetical protein
VRELLAAATADAAEVVCPTHVMRDESGRIVGYGSAGRIRLLAGWTGPTVSDDASRAALRLMEQAAAESGAPVVAIACAAACRFERLMADAGYRKGEMAQIYFKRVNPKPE